MCQHVQTTYECGHKLEPHLVLECEKVLALLQEYRELKGEEERLGFFENDYEDPLPYPTCCPAKAGIFTNVHERLTDRDCMDCLLVWLMKEGGVGTETNSYIEAVENQGKLVLLP